MPHIEPERLALLAMGEPALSQEDADHFASCATCVDELAALRHAALAGRASLDVGDLESPPDVVWNRIAEELSLASASDALAGEESPAASAPIELMPAEPAEAEPAPVPMLPAVTPAAAASIPVTKAPRWRGWVLAAAITLVAGAGLGAWAFAQQPTQTEVAEAALTAFPDHSGAAGTAVVEEGGDGSFAVRVNLSADAAPDTFREVWLITADASALVSLGVLDGQQAVFSVPKDVDLRDYVLVDISQEPMGGDSGHSGDSIVRGELTFL